MAVNNNPARITAPMWRLWDERPNKSWKLGGIWADFKKGYHNSVINNKSRWPGNYSIRFPLDLVNINLDKARAIDLTMSDAEMRQWTRRMRDSALDPNDTRLDAVREFYGTLDSKTVYGLIKDSATGVWREASADLTHLWHGHMGVFTFFVNNWEMLEPILSVWRGESFAEWSMNNMQFPKKGDQGETVKYWQYVHNIARGSVKSPSPEVEVDGDYGDATAAAFVDFWKKSGGKGTYTGDKLTAWIGIRYLRAYTLAVAPKFPGIPDPSPVTEEQIKSAVDAWLDKNMPEIFTIEGTLKGTLKK